MTVTGSITSLVSTIVMGKVADRPNVGAPIVFLIVSIGTLVSVVAMNFSLVKQTSVSIIAVWVVASAFLFGQMAFVDTFVLHVCKYYGSRTSFVEQRLWSSIGNVVLSPITGLAVSVFDLWGMFGMFAIANVVMVLFTAEYFVDPARSANSPTGFVRRISRQPTGSRNFNES